MTDWKIHSVNVELENKRASVTITGDRMHVNINQLQYDEPGQQTEGEIRKLVLKRARDVLQDVLENAPDS